LADARNLDERTLKLRMEREIMNQVTLPNGKLDIEKAKLVLQELQIKIKELKANPKLMKQILAQQGGHLSATTKAGETAIRALANTYAEIVRTLGSHISTSMGNFEQRLKNEAYRRARLPHNVGR
jgi:CII-binding regulator of phage lambda lysogenization HflD